MGGIGILRLEIKNFNRLYFPRPLDGGHKPTESVPRTLQIGHFRYKIPPLEIWHFGHL